MGPALYVAQREAGWLPSEVMAEVGALFGLDETEVGEFASFYHMYNTHHEPGEYHIEVCDNVPCMLRGSGKLAEHARRSGSASTFGETTPDGKFTLGHVECLGACATAPMFMCTEKKTGKIRYFEELDTPEKLDEALALIASGQGFDTTRTLAARPLPPRRPAGHELPAGPRGQARTRTRSTPTSPTAATRRRGRCSPAARRRRR